MFYWCFSFLFYMLPRVCSLLRWVSGVNNLYPICSDLQRSFFFKLNTFFRARPSNFHLVWCLWHVVLALVLVSGWLRSHCKLVRAMSLLFLVYKRTKSALFEIMFQLWKFLNSAQKHINITVVLNGWHLKILSLKIFHIQQSTNWKFPLHME